MILFLFSLQNIIYLKVFKIQICVLNTSYINIHMFIILSQIILILIYWNNIIIINIILVKIVY